ncbi:MAG: DNA primase, partial [Bacilli bacterium]|nr:DNA primase [Bacilli bacterium]
MAFDPSLREDILKQVDIVKVISYYQPVIKKGREYVAICPFHDDSNPSLHISPEKQIFKCFVCGTGGNAINYVERRENLPYFEALKKVAEISGIHDPRLEQKQFVKPIDQKKIPLLATLKDLTTYYSYALSTEEGKAGLDYFKSRQIDEAMQVKYKLGYAFDDGKNTISFLQSKGHSLKDIEECGIAMVISGKYTDKNAGRVVFPICDIDGNVIAYSARTLKKKDEAKYVNTQETYLFHKSSVLYNYHIAKQKARIEGYVYVLEGFMDVFALSRIGIDSAVALMGTALTNEHIALLRKLGVPIRLCLDGDKPGQDATLKAAKLLAKAGLSFSIVDNQNRNDDPDEIYINQGENALRAYLNNTISREDFALNYFRNTNPLQSMDQKNALVKEFIPILLNINSQLEFDTYVRKLANVTGFEAESIRKVVLESRKNPEISRDDLVSKYNPENKLLRRLLLAEREMLYQMLNHKEAVEFYERELSGFYDETFRTIANYVIEYYSKHDELNVSNIISSLEEVDADNKDKLIQTMTDLQFEKNHPTSCNQALLDGLMKNMEDEREKIFEEDRMKNSLTGKSPQEQARLLQEYNRRKLNKLKK